MRIITNLTQHAPSPDQLAEGVGQPLAGVAELLNFTTLPSTEEVRERARKIALLAQKADAHHVMIGGAPFLMGPLTEALLAQGMNPMFAFTERVSEEQAQPDGSTKKVSVFKHAGWVAAR